MAQLSSANYAELDKYASSEAAIRHQLLLLPYGHSSCKVYIIGDCWLFFRYLASEIHYFISRKVVGNHKISGHFCAGGNEGDQQWILPKDSTGYLLYLRQ
jgi:hypothetical protein